MKVAEVCRQLGQAFASADGERDCIPEDFAASPVEFKEMRFEIRITVEGKVGRIKILAANPRTARGFSGDLILDEFAFHEDSAAIWEAAEPILSSNPDFLCRIASTGNGKHNMFYRLVSGRQFPVWRVTRTDAWRHGVKVYHPVTRQPITPGEARKLALDKRAYDQNYECAFADENMVLLTHELIESAERDGIPVDDQEWSRESLHRMAHAVGDLYVGVDVGRNRDLSVVWVIEVQERTKRTVAVLRMENTRLPAQQRQIDQVCAIPKFRLLLIDLTGIGLGLCEYLQETWGMYRIQGIHFSMKVPITNRILAEGRKAEKVSITEAMATDLLGAFESRCIQIPVDEQLRDDLRKPERLTTPGGRVSISAVRDEAGHADHFWGLALANYACGMNFGPVAFERCESPEFHDSPWSMERIPSTLRGCLFSLTALLHLLLS
jgi:phage FluMu gp28-like protein